MPTYGGERDGGDTRRQYGPAALVLVVALTTTYLPADAQQSLANGITASVLRPFIGLQERLVQSKLRGTQVDLLVAELDSLTEVQSARGALEDENRTLRALLGLSERVGPDFVAATVLRPGTAGSESMFLVDRGSQDGVLPGAPVVNADGLVGVIREVRAKSSVGMDWTHPDFRASAMLEDGSAYGIVENRRGAFREEDRLVLNGTAYNEVATDGLGVVTSGLGGIFPRGIPVGRIDGVAEEQGTWLKSYWLRPNVAPGSVTHVLVARGEVADSLGPAWALPLDSFPSGEREEPR